MVASSCGSMGCSRSAWNHHGQHRHNESQIYGAPSEPNARMIVNMIVVKSIVVSIMHTVNMLMPVMTPIVTISDLV